MPQSSVSAGGDERKSLILRLQPPRRRGDQSGTRGAKGMANRQRPSLRIQLALVDLSDLLPPELFVGERLRIHGHQVAQDLSGECLVYFEDADIRFKVQVVSG